MDYSKKVVIESDVQIKEIYNKYSDEYLYSIYLGYYPATSKMYNSPFKKERNPSFNFYIKDGRLKFKDYSSTYTGTVIDLIMLMYSLTYKEAIFKLYNDLNGTHIKPYNKEFVNTENSPKVIQVITKDFTQEDIDYWEQYYFDIAILNKYNIKSCDQVWLTTPNKDILWYSYMKTNPCYRYLFNKKYKCYKPLESNNSKKWVSNCNNYENIQGLDYLTKSDIIIITKSYKDVICMNEFIDIPSIAFHGEGHFIDEKIIKWLKKEYKHIYFFYDNDTPGLSQAQKLSELYDIPYFHIPSSFEEKDISDYIKSYGIIEGKKLINNLF